MEVHICVSTLCNKESSYPKTIEEEVQQSPAPPFVNAAHYMYGIVYMIAVDTVYAYSTFGTAPTLTYVFLKTFQFTENGSDNPFTAGLSSALDNPPSNISALYGNFNLILALSGREMYSYDISQKNWEYERMVSWPCGA